MVSQRQMLAQTDMSRVYHTPGEPFVEKVANLDIMGWEIASFYATREAEIGLHLTHPHLCGAKKYMVDHSKKKTTLYIPYIDGTNLSSNFDDGDISLCDALRTIADATYGLERLHEAGIIYRDFKLSNVMRAPITSGRGHHGILIDFGIAVPLPSSNLAHLRNKEEQVVGTLGGFAPEVFRGGGLSPQYDVFCVANSVLEAVTGGALFSLNSWFFRYGKVPNNALSRKMRTRLALNIDDQITEYFLSGVKIFLSDIYFDGAKPKELDDLCLKLEHAFKVSPSSRPPLNELRDALNQFAGVLPSYHKFEVRSVE